MSIWSSWIDVLAHPLFSLFVGSAVTWFCASFYFKRAGDHLRAEAARLKQTNSAILYFLEHPGASIEVQRDADGHPVGLIVSAAAHSAARSSAVAVGSDGTPHS